MTAKPQRASDYRAEETDSVVAACLTIVGALGDVAKNVCVVGGLVPGLLIDLTAPPADVERRHCGTNDLDVALHLALLDNEGYKEISDRLRREGFAPDANLDGNRTPQRWRRGHLRVTIEFLIPPSAGDEDSVRIKHLEGDFAAVVIPGLELAFAEREEIQLEGTNLEGEQLARSVAVCGPAAFTVLKAAAFANRAASKDAYDLIYVLANWRGGVEDVADRMLGHSSAHEGVVSSALTTLASDFATVDHVGPRRAARFGDIDERSEDERAADAVGHVDDLLRACRARAIDYE